MDLSRFDLRPLIVAVAGPNGAGKTTFFRSHLASCELEFINADAIALERGIGPYEAAEAADRLRWERLNAGESFVFETVFSDPVGDKLRFLREAVHRGYNVVLCFIYLQSAELSMTRVSMRVDQGGHDIPNEKLAARYPRSLRNLQAAIRTLPEVLVFDNSGSQRYFQFVAEFVDGTPRIPQADLPDWLQALLAEPENPA